MAIFNADKTETPLTETGRPSRLPRLFPFYYGWVIVALVFLSTLSSSGVRSALPVFINPLEAEFGWSRTSISWAGGISLLLLGIGAPISGWLQDRYGPRRVMLGGLMLLATGALASTMMRELWHLIAVWGLVVGIAGAGLGSVLTATVGQRWFVARRGLVLGILNSAYSTGQLIFIPVLMSVVVVVGWRVACLMMVTVCLVVAGLVAVGLRNDPADVGLEPLGAGAPPAGQPFTRVEASAGQSIRPAKAAVPAMGILDAAKTSTFWLLCGCYFVCGSTANGLVGVHLIPHAIERGIPAVNAAWTVGVMGGMNFVGTLLSGWLTDRVDARKLLAAVFALRGGSLFILPYVQDFNGLAIFGVIYGLDWFASVPPVIYIAGETFGKRSIGRIFGWIFLCHQLGAFVSAVGAGTIFDWVGRYEPAFLIGGFVGLAGAAMALTIRLRTDSDRGLAPA